MNLINVGFGNLVAGARILCIVSPDSAPSRRLVQEAKGAGGVINATQGRKTRAILVLDNGTLVLSALNTDTLAARCRGGEVPDSGRITDSHEMEEEE